MREHLDDPREGEYFSEKGLTSLTGLPREWWSLVILKELIDNSLDAIEGLKDKCITIEYADKTFFIDDTYGGIPENVIESIHDFSKYVSNKRHYIAISRGYQGNALKTVIGICHLMNAKLEFISNNKKISYKIDESKLAIGIVRFKRVVEILSGGENKPGIKITGILFSHTKIYEKIQTYHLCNPEVSFVCNGNEFNNITVKSSKESGKKRDHNFIHWYDIKSFNKLLQAIAYKDPRRTTKTFCNVFSSTQRVLSGLDFPYKRLSDFAEKKEAVSLLYEKLKDLVPQPSPKYLEKYIIGKNRLKDVFGKGYEFKYNRVHGEFRHHEVDIPFCLEISLHRSDYYSDADIVSTINRSVPYESCPFRFNNEEIKFNGKKYEEDSLLSILNQAGFKEARGVRLFIHFISPYIEFTEQSKTRLVSDHFKDKLIGLIEPMTSGVIKEVEKARKGIWKKSNSDRKSSRSNSKRALMKRYFMKGYEMASQGHKVTVRQIFYAVRNIINIRYQRNLNQTDYSNTFTQEIATYFIEKYPEFQDRILFERRGYFYNPVTGDELPLGTEDVLTYIKRIIRKGIYRKTKTFYSIPDELMFKQVLFVEKAGFNIIFKESGLLDKLNLGVMSTQGFGTRAVKRLIKYFLDKGIKVYILHDYDIPGYLICDKFLSGSYTYKEGLDVIKIGLTLDDAKKLGKDREEYAEVIPYKKSYKKVIERLNLSQDEKKFLVVDGEAKIYRRAELNTLTSPELISFIESKITHNPIIPTVEQLKDYISMDKTEIIKNALYEVYASNIPSITIDKEKVANRIHRAIRDKKHWTLVLDDVLGKYTEEKVQELQDLIRKGL